MFVVALLLFLPAAVAVVTGVLGLTGTLPPNRFFGPPTASRRWPICIGPCIRISRSPARWNCPAPARRQRRSGRWAAA
ncbi:hypothetical protein FHY52_03660 [Nocardia nova]|nr:hypothetical protein [Nocardia nova]